MATGDSLDILTADDFRAVQGDTFRLKAGSDKSGAAVYLDVELKEVTGFSGGRPGALRTSFSVLFHGPLSPVMPQAIYRLEHEGLGALELFIVPLGPDQAGGTAMRYEAVFG
jgi:hypothetical protein